MNVSIETTTGAIAGKRIRSPSPDGSYGITLQCKDSRHNVVSFPEARLLLEDFGKHFAELVFKCGEPIELCSETAIHE